MRVTSLQLLHWRNFKAAKVDLTTRVFIVGPNASGKSNLLDAFRFLRDVASIGGGLANAVEARGGVKRVRCLAARKNPDVRLRVTLGDDSDPEQWTYELEFGANRQQRPVVRKEVVSYRGEELKRRPDVDDENDPVRLTQTALEQVTENRSFRNIADFLSSIQYLHLVPQLVREPDRSINHPNDPFGGDFLQQIASVNQRTRAARLRRINEALRFAVPQLENLDLQQDRAGRWHLRGKYQHWRAPGAWQDESDLSDGTLRLIGLLWTVLDTGGPLLLEEPELSLHPEVIRFLPALFAKAQSSSLRQVLISTHSPDLLYDEGIGLDEVVVLRPGPEGTTVHKASQISDALVLLRGGTTLPELLAAETRPAQVSQLALFQP
ncbi:AAA family ATPase [Rhabdothermincola sp.]|uniref:AAA family ATPase n=1 Tax=Rhabdothermincola sp. TaxID=2820405 RepID=UPI002FE190A9